MKQSACAVCSMVTCAGMCAQGVSQDELMVDAQQELLRAAERFDASKGARLTTYAWHNIMNRLTLVTLSPLCVFEVLALVSCIVVRPLRPFNLDSVFSF